MAARKKAKAKGKKGTGTKQACTLRVLDLSKAGLTVEQLARQPWPKKKVRLFFLNKGIVVKSKEELLALLLLACKAGNPPVGTLNAPFKLGAALGAV